MQEKIVASKNFQRLLVLVELISSETDKLFTESDKEVLVRVGELEKSLDLQSFKSIKSLLATR